MEMFFQYLNTIHNRFIMGVTSLLNKRNSNIHSAKAKGGLLVNIIWKRVRSRLPVDYKPDLIVLSLLGKEWIGCNFVSPIMVEL